MKCYSIKEHKKGINILSKSTGEASIDVSKILPPKVNYQPKRMFGTTASMLLKVLRNA
jgi:hypothetical protein